jgi:excisionase family DNA binding protein
MGELLSLNEAAERLGINVATMRIWVREGRIPAYRLGQRFTRVDWVALLKAISLQRGSRPASMDANRQDWKGCCGREDCTGTSDAMAIHGEVGHG